MKRIVAIMFVASLWVVGQSQTITAYSLRKEPFGGNTYTITQTDSVNNPQKFLNAKQWAVKTFAEYKDVIQYEDAQNGRLVVKGVLPVNFYYGTDTREKYTPLLRFTLTVDIKPEKYRLKFENMSILLIKEVGLGAMSHTSKTEMPLSEFMGINVPAEQNRDNLSAALTGLINSAISSITFYDDF